MHLSFKKLNLNDNSSLKYDNDGNNSIDQVQPCELSNHSIHQEPKKRPSCNQPSANVKIQRNGDDLVITKSSLLIEGCNGNLTDFQNHKLRKSGGTCYTNPIKNFEDRDKRLKDLISALASTKKPEGSAYSTLYSIRNSLVGWVKENENDYNLFITEKKIKYLLKHKDRLEGIVKSLEPSIIRMQSRKEELDSKLGDLYCYYDYRELRMEIEKLENSYEIKQSKSKKAIEKLEEMKLKLPLVKEQNHIKYTLDLKSLELENAENNLASTFSNLKGVVKFYKSLKNVGTMTAQS